MLFYYIKSISSQCVLENYVLNFDSGGIAESDYLMLSYDSKSGKEINCADFINIPEITTQNGNNELENILAAHNESNISSDYLYLIEYYYVRCIR